MMQEEFTRQRSNRSSSDGGDSVSSRKVFSLLLLLFSILSASTPTWAWVTTVPTVTSRRQQHPVWPIVATGAIPSGSNSCNSAAEKNEDSAKDTAAAAEESLWKSTTDDDFKKSFPSSMVFSREDVELAFREEAERLGYPNLFNRTNRSQHQALISKIDRNMRVANVQSSMNQLLSSLSSSSCYSYPNEDFVLHNQTTTTQPRSSKKNILSSTNRGSEHRQKKLPTPSAPLHDLDHDSHDLIADVRDLDARPDHISTAENARKVNILRNLEATLQQSVRSHDFETAQECKKQLDDLQFQDHISLIAANAQFYRAFSTQDVRAMEHVWLAHSPTTCLIHPLHQPIYGAKEISESWKQLLGEDDGPNASPLRSCWIEPAHIQVSVLDGATMGIVVCEERVYARSFVRGHRRKTELVNTLTATNVFRKINVAGSSPSWKLLHHHSSSTQTLNNNTTIATDGNKYKHDRNHPREKPSAESILDAMMGHRKVGPIVNAPAPAPLPVKKRIVVRDIAELFAIDGEDDDDEEEEEDDDDDELRNDVFSAKGKSKKNRRRRADLENRNVDDDEDDEEDGDIEIIDEDEDEYYDDDDDDDDDDEEDHHENDVEKFPYHQGSNLQGVMKKQWRESEFTTDRVSNAKKYRTEQRKHGGGDSLVMTLRKLGNSGMISLRQKRVLLTDLITSAAKGQVPMVQVAYNLLLSDDHVDEDQLAAAEEEFAEQCRIFADNLLHSEEDASPQITRSVYE